MAEYIPETQSADDSTEDEVDKVEDKCIAHEDQKIVLFCITCEEGICLECMTENSHGQHKLCKLHEATEIIQTIFQEIVQKVGIDRLRKKIARQAKEIQEKKIVVENNQRRTYTAVQTRSKHLADAIEKNRQRLSLLFKDTHAQKLDVLNDLESTTDKLFPLLRKYSENPDSFCRTHKDDLLSLVRHMRKLQLLDQVDVSTLPAFLVGPKVNDEFMSTFFGYTKYANREKPAVMELVKTIKISLKGYKMAPINKISPLDMQTAYVLIFTDLYIAKFGFESITECTLKENDLVVMEGVLDVTQVTEKGLYVCREFWVELCTFDKKSYELEHPPNPKTTKIKSVCINKAGHVVCCLEQERPSHPYTRNTTTGTIFHTFDKDGVRTKEASQWLSNDGYMYRVEEYDNVRYLIGRNMGKGKVVSDKDNYFKCVTEFYNGVIGGEPETMFDPRGICFDKNGQMIIADYGNHAIHLLDRKGKFLKFLLREWDGLHHPTAVTLDKHGFLWIGQENGIIQVRRYES